MELPGGGGRALSERALRALGFLLLALGTARLGITVAERQGELDFAHYYGSARMVLEGGSPYGALPYERWGLDPAITEAMSERPSGGSNPPGLIALTVPFALLPPAAAQWAWNGVQLAALAWILVLARALVRPRLLAGPYLVLSGLVLLSGSVYWHVYFGQTQILLAALLLSGAILKLRGRAASGLVLAVLAGLLKLFPVALLPWFAWRTRPREWIPAALVLGAGILAMWPLWPGFVDVGLGVVRGLAIDHTMNLSVPSLILNVGALATGSTDPGRLWWLAAAGVAVAILAAAYAAPVGDERKLLLLLAVLPAVTVTGWSHYFVFLVPAFVLAAADFLGRPTQGRLALLAVAWFFGVNAANGSGAIWGGAWAAMALNYLPLIGLGALVWMMVGEPRAEGTRTLEAPADALAGMARDDSCPGCHSS